MNYFNDFKMLVCDGDQILTTPNWINAERVVTYKNNYIIIDGETFNWDYFFEVNTPIDILNRKMAKPLIIIPNTQEPNIPDVSVRLNGN